MVATVVSLTSVSSTVRYFEQDGYYAKGSREHRRATRWYGAGAAALGLTGHVDPAAFAGVLDGRVPGTEIVLGSIRDGERAHRAGLDVTLSAPKSVSLLALVFGDRRGRRAHDAAVRETLDFVEADLLRTRRYDRATRRQERIPAAGLVAATFRHVTSRNLDPQLHTHCVIANMTRDDRGRWRSLELRHLQIVKHLIGAFYRDRLAAHLRAAGFALRPSMIGHLPGFEVAGYGRALIDGFSSRREEMLRYLRERGWTYTPGRAQQATLATRKRKKEPHLEELEAHWRAHPAVVAHAPDRRGARPRKGSRPPEEPVPSALEVAWRAAEQLEERVSVFPAHQLTALALAHSPGRHGLSEVRAALGRLQRDGHLRGMVRRTVGECFVTDRAVRAEREVIRRMRAQQGAAEPLADADAVRADLEASGLTDGQQDAVRAILLAHDRTVGVQGYAGTGKTTMLAHVARLAGGRRILGLAPSASAARSLGRETGLACRTLQWFLARHRAIADGTAGEEELSALRGEFSGCMLVVDEMSLASTRQALSLLRIADQIEVGRLVLVGDRRQLRAVSAGQPFRQLQEAGMRTALMQDIRRQRNPDLRAAVLHAVAGKPALAIDRLGGNLVEVPADELGETAAHAWLALPPEDRAETPILAPTHELRARINDTIREGLRAEGGIHGRTLMLETLTSRRMTRSQLGDLRNWSEGDVALFHNALYGYRIRAGDACTVTGFRDGAALLEHPDGKARHIRPDGNIRYRLDLCETRTIEVQAGDRIRWTRNDKQRNLLNGAEATILAIGPKTARLRTDDGRTLRLRHDDPQLRHVTHAWASTVHAAQGLTRDNVIVVLDSGHGPLTNQQTFYVEISRARQNAIVLTDNREQLVETLEAHTGLSATALEALGESLTEDLGPPPPGPAPAGPATPRPEVGPAATSPEPPARPMPARAPVPPGGYGWEPIDRPQLVADHPVQSADQGWAPAPAAGTEAVPDPPAGQPAPRRRQDVRKGGWFGRFLWRATAEVQRIGGDEIGRCLHVLARALAERRGLLDPASDDRTAFINRSGYRFARVDIEVARLRARRLFTVADETGLTLGARERQEIENRVAAADRALQEDDAAFARRTAGARSRHWLEQWNAAATREPQAVPGAVDPRAALAAQGRRILADVALPAAERAVLEPALRQHDAILTATREGNAWLEAWRALAAGAPDGGRVHTLPGVAPLLERGHDLVRSPHLPDDLRRQIDEPVAVQQARRDEQERLQGIRERARARARAKRERRDAARKAAAAYMVSFDRALAAGRKGVTITPERLDALIGEGQAVAADPHLPDFAGRPRENPRLALHILKRCRRWRHWAHALQENWRDLETRAGRDTHAFALEKGPARSRLAHRLAKNKPAMMLFPDLRREVETIVFMQKAWTRTQEKYDRVMAGWEQAVMDAESKGFRKHESTACSKALGELQALAVLVWLSREQQETIKAAVQSYHQSSAKKRGQAPGQRQSGVRRTPDWSPDIQ